MKKRKEKDKIDNAEKRKKIQSVNIRANIVSLSKRYSFEKYCLMEATIQQSPPSKNCASPECTTPFKSPVDAPLPTFW